MTLFDSNTKQTLVSWAQGQISAEITLVEEIAVTAFSFVLKLHTSEQIYYLKKTPPKLYIEASVVNILNNVCACKNVPLILAHDDALECFLMPSCGDYTLRTLFKEHFMPEPFDKGLSSYLELQTATQSHLNDFLQIGVPDWRTSNLPNVYDVFIKDKERLSEWGLNNSEVERFESSIPLFLKLCDELDELGLPDSLNHSDFHPNAMLLDETTSEIKIIDLGEVTVGNPLLSYASCITHYLDHRWQVRSDAQVYNQLKNTVIRKLDIDKQKGTELIEIVGPLNYCLCFRELMELCDHNFPKWHEIIKVAFFDYLNNLENRYLT